MKTIYIYIYIYICMYIYCFHYSLFRLQNVAHIYIIIRENVTYEGFRVLDYL